jgi:hypothetical protein
MAQRDSMVITGFNKNVSKTPSATGSSTTWAHYRPASATMTLAST